MRGIGTVLWNEYVSALDCGNSQVNMIQNAINVLGVR